MAVHLGFGKVSGIGRKKTRGCSQRVDRDIASQKCRCDPNAVIIEAPKEPELVGKPAPQGYCDYCQARIILKEQCPEVFEPRIRTYSTAEVFAEGCRSFVRIGTRKEFEVHQAKLEKEYPFEEELSQDEPKPRQL